MWQMYITPGGILKFKTMQITVYALEHFSKEIHTYLQILNTSNMETEHAYIVFTYKGNFVQ